MRNAKIIAFATKGTGTNDEARILKLLQNFNVQVFPFERTAKLQSSLKIIQQVLQTKPNLVVMEGTGIAGGLACLLLNRFFGIPYVFSSGDAIAPFISLNYPFLVPIVSIYEQLLCRFCAGFIGWTPYLVGRALTFAAPKGVTAAGWAHFPRTTQQLMASREVIRKQLGIPEDSLVFGLLGAIVWNQRLQYCYGYELIQAFRRINRENISILIAGDGNGFSHLKQLAGEDLDKRIFLPGNVPYEQVLDYLAAMDVASLPQTLDGVGSFRYTTKISEYFAARLPVVTSQIPMAYEIGSHWVWRLPGAKPWEERYLNALATLMQNVTEEEIDSKKQAMPSELLDFDRAQQIARITGFVDDILSLSDRSYD